MKNNKGFSLVELIVVIAIMVILSAVTAAALANQPGWKVKNAEEMLRTAIGETRMEAMSKHRASLTITKEADGCYIQITGKEKERLGNSKNIQIFYGVNGGDVTTELTPGMKLEFSFDRSSGAFTPIINGTDASGNYQYRSQTQGGTSVMLYCTGIAVKCGNSGRELVLVKDTGKYYEK